jgi:hypothetical protein
VSLSDGTVSAVPEISRFHGIVIFMFHGEGRHMGRPHFHAVYAENDVSIDIETLEVPAGRLPRRQLQLVMRWARLHRAELSENWLRARRKDPLMPIQPLP